MTIYNLIDSLFVYASLLALVASVVIYIGITIKKCFRGKSHG